MPIQVKTKRLVLRPLGSADLQTVHAYASDAETTAYMLRLPSRTPQQTAQFLACAEQEWQKQPPRFYEFAITLAGRQIGAVSLYLEDAEPAGELGWILDQRYWRQGFATEAAQAILEFARGLGLSRLTAHCDARNIASRRVMEKIGMTLEDDSALRIYPETGERARELLFGLALLP